MTTHHRIESKAGTIMGVYPGATPEESWAAMIADGGSSGDHDGAPDDWIIRPAVPCIMVSRSDDGHYERIGAAVAEDWRDVCAECEVEHIEALTGWGDYTAAYRVTSPYGSLLTYMVAE